MYESVKKESEKKTFPQKALEMAGSVSDSESSKWLCLKVKLETGAGSGPRSGPSLWAMIWGFLVYASCLAEGLAQLVRAQ